jgi:ATP diphosphatase
MDANKSKYDLEDLKNLMILLRNPEKGCPWDVEQNFQSIKPHTIEEAYEVADAIEREDMNDLKDELGDLLFQIVFHAQMADEKALFNIDDIIDHVTKKMIFRHPHVFGNDKTHTASDVKNIVWEAQKDKEKASEHNENYLDSLTMNLPALLLASKIQKKVCKVGFQYPNFESVLEKLDEEIAELKGAIEHQNQSDIEDEFGDILFVTALLGRHCGVDNPEETLRKANLKFIRRFHAVETYLKEEKKLSLRDATIEDMSAAWIAIKTQDNEKP